MRNKIEFFFNKWFKHFILFNRQQKNLIFWGNSPSKKNILVIDHHIPFFDRDAGSYRMYNLLKIFTELNYNVNFIGDDINHLEPYDTVIEHLGVQVLYYPKIRSIKNFLSRWGQYYQIVIISRPNVAEKYFDDVRFFCYNAKIVYDTVDLRYLRQVRLAELKNDKKLMKKANKLKEIELQLIQKSDVIFVVSSIEKRILLQQNPLLNIHVVSLIYDINYPPSNFVQRQDLLFLGGFLHSPNVDGIEWFIKEIFPLIMKIRPDIKLYIVGDNPPKKIQTFSSRNIIITGYQEDLSGFFNHCRVFIAPLRFGAGLKGKIIHSMSNGLPVVTTTIGSEGIGIIDGYNGFVSDDPALFADKVIQLYQREEIWNKFSIAGIEHIKNNYSYKRTMEQINQILRQI